ncbi:hypothetical protein FF38_03577, partial [Lucilia cuprina]
MKTALKIFREKIPEPMKTILACRDPDSIENAMDILFISGYANYWRENASDHFAKTNSPTTKNRSHANYGKNYRT